LNGDPTNGNVLNDTFNPSLFSSVGKKEIYIDEGTGAYVETANTSILKKSILDEIEVAITKLEQLAPHVQNCNCRQVVSCQSMKCQLHVKGTSNCDWNTCQTVSVYNEFPSCQTVTCQYKTCQMTVCQRGNSCQDCQSCEMCQICEMCESQCLCQTCQACQEKTYDVWSCQSISCQSCESCQLKVCENITCQASRNDGKDL